MPDRRDVLAMIGAGVVLAGWPLGRAARAESLPALGEMTLGRADAPVTVIEYFSLGCSHCRDFHVDTFDAVKANYIDTGKVHFVARDFPTNEYALRAAMLARCAGETRYFRFVDTFFDAFDFWTRADDPLEAIAQIAALGGIPRDRFAVCIVDTDVEMAVLTGQMTGVNEYGVEYTPTFFVNGTKYVGALPYGDLSSILDRLLGSL